MNSATLSAMLKKEQSTFRCRDYLHDGLSSNGITQHVRRQLVDWCFSVVDICNFQRDTVVAAFGLLDRFLSIPSECSARALKEPSEYQLLAITSLYIAIKMNESVSVGSTFFSSVLSKDGYSIKDIEETEKVILWGLSWHLNAPSTLEVAMQILSVLDVHLILSKDSLGWLVEEICTQSELAVRNYELSIQRPSSTALSILFRISWQVPNNEGFKLLFALRSIVQSFDFDVSCKKKVEAFI